MPLLDFGELALTSWTVGDLTGYHYNSCTHSKSEQVRVKVHL